MGFAEQARISEQHRLAQAQLQAVVVRDMARIMPALDVNNVDTTFGPWFDTAYKLITARRTVSASLGATYYNAIRADHKLGDAFTPFLDAIPDKGRVFTSLLVTGPIAMKKNLAAGVEPMVARDAALKTIAQAAQRHVIEGGRQTVIRSARRDPRAHGWARLTDGAPCAFCALLASRGPVYRTEKTGGFKSHDGCGCTAVPVFDPNAPWPGRAEEFRKAYDENISGRFAGGDGNNEAVKAWRKFYDGSVEPDPMIPATKAAKTLVANATKIEPALTAEMQRLADTHQGELKGLDFRLKTPESLARKIAKDVAEGKGALTVDQVAGKMFDVNRYTMQFAEETYSDSAQRVINELEAAGNKVKVNNYWNVADNPYQGINLQVTTPSGAQYELQFHTPTSLAVKEGDLHKIYELSRKETDVAKIAEYTRQSFEAAAKIPVPKGAGLVELGRQLPAPVKRLSLNEVASIAKANPEMTATQDDNWLFQIRENLGFNAKPKLVTSNEIAQLEKQGWVRTYRGLNGNKAAQWVEQFKTGENFAGLGMYGSGTYTAVDAKAAEFYAHQIKENVLQIAISPDAKIIDIKELRKLQKTFLEELAKANNVNLDNLMKMLRTGDDAYDIYMDAGRFAALQGYDVISAVHGEAGMYYNVLNRAKVVVVK